MYAFRYHGTHCTCSYTTSRERLRPRTVHSAAHSIENALTSLAFSPLFVPTQTRCREVTVIAEWVAGVRVVVAAEAETGHVVVAEGVEIAKERIRLGHSRKLD